MPRALLLILDSFGIGGAPDAAAYGDEGANTFGHIGDHVPLQIPTMMALGLGYACEAASGHVPKRVERPAQLIGRWGYGVETSRGKDTPSGHWEIAGVPIAFDWGYFPRTVPAFPGGFTDALIAEGRLPGLLGNKHAAGTEIILELGEEHLRTGKPIIYTSVDSVIQIAAHEEHASGSNASTNSAASRAGLPIPSISGG